MLPSLHLARTGSSRGQTPLCGLAVWRLGRSRAPGLGPRTEIHGLALPACVCPPPDSLLSGMVGAAEELALDLQPSFLMSLKRNLLEPQELCLAPP